MEKQVEYSGLEDRKNKIAENEAQGLRMLHDDFDADWQQGEEPRGVLTFTDEPCVEYNPPIPQRDFAAELDDHEIRIGKLEKK